MNKLDKKTVKHSKTVMSQIMLPGQANPAGNVHGGEIMKLMDDTAYVVARKHCRKNVVTARVDELQFHQPIYVDNLTTCHGKLIFVGTSSMEVSIKIEVDDLSSDEKPQTALTAFFTMVALDEKGNPIEVPDLKLKTKQEKKDFARGKERYLKYQTERNT